MGLRERHGNTFSLTCHVRFCFSVAHQTQLLTFAGCISPSVMLPEHRLGVLLQQVKNSQIARCLHHNSALSPSLYQDHSCERGDFPKNNFVELNKHTGEVYCVAFSNDGKRLASSGEDGLLVIYDVETFESIHTLSEHDDSIGFVSWSPDDSLLVTCSVDKHAKIWDTHVS